MSKKSKFERDLKKTSKKVFGFFKKLPKILNAGSNGDTQDFMSEVFAGFDPKKNQKKIREYVNSLQLGKKEEANEILKSLEEYPMAREYLKKFVDAFKYKWYERRMDEIVDDKTFIFKDPFADKEKKNEKEKPEHYELAYEQIRPANPSLAVLNRPEDCQDSKWNSLKKKYTGKLVFANSPIDKDETDDGKFKTSFVLGKDDIYGRAYWSHAIYNYPIGKDKKSGNLLYPPKTLEPNKHKCELLFLLYIDGKKQIIRENPFGEIYFFEETQEERDELNDGPNFYLKNQSCKVNIQKQNLSRDEIFDENVATPIVRYNYFFSKLNPGKHDVKIEMCYRIISEESNMTSEKPILPEIDTLLSHPIAIGNFEIVVPSGYKLPNPIPKNNTSVSNLKEIQKAIDELGKEYNAKEVYIGSSIQGNIYPSIQSNLYEGIVAQWGLDCLLLYYRDPRKGHNYEHVRLFDKSCFTFENQTKQGSEKKMPPIQKNLGVTRSIEFDADMLPNEVFNGIERCKKQDAHAWLNHLSEEDKKYLHREF